MSATATYLPWVDAKRGGVVANGTTDDQTKLQSLLDGVASDGGGGVFIRPYSVVGLGGGLQIPSGVRLFSVGRQAASLKFLSGVSAGTNMIEVKTSTTEQIGLEGLTLDLNSHGNHGIYIANADNAPYPSGRTDARHGPFRDLYIHHAPGDGVHLTSGLHSGGGSFYNVETYYCDGHGFYIANADNALVGCIAGQSGLDGFRDSDGGSNTLSACKAWLSGRISTTSGQGVGFRSRTRSLLVGCYAQDNGYHGISLFNAEGVIVAGCIADTNGTRAVGGANGVDFDGAANCRIDISAFDRGGDSGTDPYVQQFAVNPGSASGCIVTGTAGNHAVGPIPSSARTTDNLILLKQNGSPNLAAQFNSAVFSTALASSAVANNTLFRDSADNKLKFKDNSGTVNALY